MFVNANLNTLLLIIPKTCMNPETFLLVSTLPKCVCCSHKFDFIHNRKSAITTRATMTVLCVLWGLSRGRTAVQ